MSFKKQDTVIIIIIELDMEWALKYMRRQVFTVPMKILLYLEWFLRLSQEFIFQVKPVFVLKMTNILIQKAIAHTGFTWNINYRTEEHQTELQSRIDHVCRPL